MRSALAVSLLLVSVACRTTCPDGKPEARREDCASTYPAYARAFVGTVSISLQATQTKLVNVNAGLASDITNLRNNYDQTNLQAELTYKALCVQRNASPCDGVIQSKLDDLLKDVDTKTTFLRQEQLAIDALASKLASAQSQTEKASITKQLEDELTHARNALAPTPPPAGSPH